MIYTLTKFIRSLRWAVRLMQDERHAVIRAGIKAHQDGYLSRHNPHPEGSLRAMWWKDSFDRSLMDRVAAEEADAEAA